MITNIDMDQLMDPESDIQAGFPIGLTSVHKLLHRFAQARILNKNIVHYYRKDPPKTGICILEDYTGELGRQKPQQIGSVTHINDNFFINMITQSGQIRTTPYGQAALLLPDRDWRLVVYS
jgi:hypothetical protein